MSSDSESLKIRASALAYAFVDLLLFEDVSRAAVVTSVRSGWRSSGFTWLRTSESRNDDER